MTDINDDLHLPSVAVSHEIPVIQFRKLEDFLDDLAAGRVIAVYHDMTDRPVRYWQTEVRALLAQGSDLHVAALTVILPVLYTAADENSRGAPVMDEEKQFAHQSAAHDWVLATVRDGLDEIGIEASAFRAGAIGIAARTQIVYARDGLWPARTVRLDAAGEVGKVEVLR